MRKHIVLFFVLLGTVQTAVASEYSFSQDARDSLEALRRAFSADSKLLDDLGISTYQALQVDEVALSTIISLLDTSRPIDQGNQALTEMAINQFPSLEATDRGKVRVAIASTEVALALGTYVLGWKLGKKTINEFLGAHPLFAEKVELREKMRAKKYQRITAVEGGQTGQLSRERNVVAMDLMETEGVLTDDKKLLADIDMEISRLDASLEDIDIHKKPAQTRDMILTSKNKKSLRKTLKTRSAALQVEASRLVREVADLDAALEELKGPSYEDARRLAELKKAHPRGYLATGGKKILRGAFKGAGFAGLTVLLVTMGHSPLTYLFFPEHVEGLIGKLKVRQGQIQRRLDDIVAQGIANESPEGNPEGL